MTRPEPEERPATVGQVYRDMSGNPIFHRDSLCWDHYALRDKMRERGIPAPNEAMDGLERVIALLDECHLIIELPRDRAWMDILTPCPHCASGTSLF